MAANRVRALVSRIYTFGAEQRLVLPDVNPVLGVKKPTKETTRDRVLTDDETRRLWEPMHVHVRRVRQQAKFWLAPVGLAWNHGFSARELNEIRRIIIEHETAIIGAWNEHCGQR